MDTTRTIPSPQETEIAALFEKSASHVTKVIKLSDEEVALLQEASVDEREKLVKKIIQAGTKNE